MLLGCVNMPEIIEVFENEEATKLLDYFAAYKKLQNKIEQIKCLAAVNSDITLNVNAPQEPSLPNDLMANQPEISLPLTLEK